MRFEFDNKKSRSVKRKHGVPTADEIGEMASRGEDVSRYFTNNFTVVRPSEERDRKPKKAPMAK